MGRRLKQYCLNGHDTFEVGRTSSGSCRVCQRAQNRSYTRGEITPKRQTRVAWAPLEERLNAAGVKWNQRVSAASRRQYQKHGLPVLLADSLAVDLLHVHPTAIWGSAWFMEDE